MANTLNLGTDGNWAVKKDSLLAYNSENNNFKPLAFDFTRASNATVVNKAGLIETVGSGEPRIDFSSDAKGALKLEPQRTNLVTYSEDFSTWPVISDVTLDADNSISPNGENTATKIIPNSSNSIHKIRLIYSSATNTYNFSVFAKKGEYKNILIWDDSVSEGIGVNLDDLSIFRNENVEGYKIEQHSNGWVRISYTRSYTSEQPLPSIYVYDNSATPQITFLGNGSDGLYIWGAQFEIGSYATSLINTQGSAVTRLADACSQTPPSGVIGQTEGVLLFNFSNNIPNVTALFGGLYYGDWGTGILIRTESGNIRVDVLSSYSGLYSYFSAININNSKLAIKWDSGVIKIFINGNLIATSGVITIPTLPSLSLSSRGGGATEHTLTYKYATLYNTALTDAELAILTTI